MPEYLAPGVYIEEIDTGPQPIEGVSTSTAGFVGFTVRGPTTGRPVLVTSYSDFRRQFGDYFNLGTGFEAYRSLPFAVDAFFGNGGKRLYVMRVTGASTVAQTTAKGGFITRLKAGQDAAVGAGKKKFKVASTRGLADGLKVKLHMLKDGIAYDSSDLEIDTNGVNRATGEVTVKTDIDITPTGPVAYEARYTSVVTTIIGIKDANTADDGLPDTGTPRPDTFVIKAKDAGSWGKDIILQAGPQTGARSEVDALVSGADGDNRLRLKSTAGFYAGAWVEIDTGAVKRYRRVKAVNGTVLTLEAHALASGDVAPVAPATSTAVTVCEFGLTVSYAGVVEQFDGLTLEKVPGKYYVDVLQGGSNLVSADAQSGGASTNPFMFPSGDDGLRIVLDAGGADVAPNDDDFVGVDGGPGNRSGLKALEDVEQISIIAAPGITSQLVQNALIEQCERLKYRFAILDPEYKANSALDDIQAQRGRYDTKYAALYFPRVMARDPIAKVNIPTAPSGHVAGVYARTDIERGVHKAPANEVLRGISGYEINITNGEQEILNPMNINVLRDFQSSNRGLRIWGARCLTSDAAWKYVPVRRLFIFLEASLDQGTQWVVFEPNDEPLWARVTQSVSNFLTRVWKDGALMGTTVEEAFFIKCDYTTMTQDDIDNGRLIMVIGVAPVKPAEFVIIRIGQKAGGAEVTES